MLWICSEFVSSKFCLPSSNYEHILWWIGSRILSKSISSSSNLGSIRMWEYIKFHSFFPKSINSSVNLGCQDPLFATGLSMFSSSRSCANNHGESAHNWHFITKFSTKYSSKISCLCHTYDAPNLQVINGKLFFMPPFRKEKELIFFFLVLHIS